MGQTSASALARILFQKDKESLQESEKKILSDWLRECPKKASMGMRKVGNNLWAAVYSLPLLLTSEIFLRQVHEDPVVRDLIKREVASAGWSTEVLAWVENPLEGEDEVLRSAAGWPRLLRRRSSAANLRTGSRRCSNQQDPRRQRALARSRTSSRISCAGSRRPWVEAEDDERPLLLLANRTKTSP
jgi:hypothetical protein